MEIFHEQTITQRYRTFRSDIPGALGVLCAIAFFTGIIDADVRENLSAALWASFVGAILFGLWYRRAIRPRQCKLVVAKERGVTLVRIEGQTIHELFVSGFSWRHGMFEEHIDAYVAARDAPVIWVQLRSKEGRTMTVRKALGIQHDVPSWPKIEFQEKAECIFSGEPLPLFEVLSRLDDAGVHSVK